LSAGKAERAFFKISRACFLASFQVVGLLATQADASIAFSAYQLAAIKLAIPINGSALISRLCQFSPLDLNSLITVYLFLVIAFYPLQNRTFVLYLVRRDADLHLIIFSIDHRKRYSFIFVFF